MWSAPTLSLYYIGITPLAVGNWGLLSNSFAIEENIWQMHQESFLLRTQKKQRIRFIEGSFLNNLCPSYTCSSFLWTCKESFCSSSPKTFSTKVIQDSLLLTATCISGRIVTAGMQCHPNIAQLSWETK